MVRARSSRSPSVVRALALALTTSIAALLALAQPAAARPADGTIVYFRAKDGSGYMSAREGMIAGGVTLSPNKDAWEQWSFSNLQGNKDMIQSFHGTVLMKEHLDGNAPGWQEIVHQPLATGTGTTDSMLPKICRIGADGACDYANRDGWDIGSEVALVMLTEGLLVSDGGVVKWITGGNQGNPVPDKGRWIVEAVATPATGRKPLRKAVQLDLPWRLKSAHGTFLRVDPKFSQPEQFVSHNANGTGFKWDRGSTTAPIRFGVPVDLVTTTDSFSPFLSAIVGGQFSLPRATWARSKWNGAYVLVPCAGGVDKERVSQATKVCVKNVSVGRFLSAEPGGVVVFSANSSGWEQWEIVP